MQHSAGEIDRKLHMRCQQVEADVRELTKRNDAIEAEQRVLKNTFSEVERRLGLAELSSVLAFPYDIMDEDWERDVDKTMPSISRQHDTPRCELQQIIVLIMDTANVCVCESRPQSCPHVGQRTCARALEYTSKPKHPHTHKRTHTSNLTHKHLHKDSLKHLSK